METSSDFSLFRKNLGIEYKKKIKKITEDLILDKSLIEKELKKIKQLEEKIKEIENSKPSSIQKIYYHVYFCKKLWNTTICWCC